MEYFSKSVRKFQVCYLRTTHSSTQKREHFMFMGMNQQKNHAHGMNLHEHDINW